ncbi:hypothetical protein [Streptomyces sp. NPDC005125]
MAANPTPVPTKVPIAPVAPPPDVDPNVPKPDFEKPTKAPDPAPPTDPKTPADPDAPREYDTGNGPIKVTPSLLRPFAEDLEDEVEHAYQVTLDLQAGTGASLGDGGDATAHALETWYPEGRLNLLGAAQSLIAGIADYAAGLKAMADDAQDAEDSARETIDDLASSLPE